jgi:predicted nucleic acid-binding protein
MIVVDTNVFLRYLTTPTSDATRRMQHEALTFFRRVESGDLEATTTEVVLHETCYILCSAKQYGFEAPRVATYLRTMLSWPGWTFPPGDRAIYLRALDIFAEYPKLEFSDSVIAARAEAMGAQLATFDERLGGMPFVDRWMPADSETDDSPHTAP